MAKAVFRPNEVAPMLDKVILESPFPEIVEEVPEAIAELPAEALYKGPRVEDLQREANEFKVRWAAQKEVMISGAHAEAEVLVNDAKKRAEDLINNAEKKAEAQTEVAKAEAEQIVALAGQKGKQVEAGSVAAFEAQKKIGYGEGFAEGKKEGYESGMLEVKRLIERTQVILKGIQDKRADILNDAEQQIIDIAILVSRKVVKTISESQRNVVAENIKEALSKVKTKGNLIIKVNLADIEITTSHRDDFIKMIEGSGNIQIMEDSTVDVGGCVVETDFGEIDARIASQFAELESKIMAISPVKGK
ncbi:MAG: flagellar assembly protein FliH [Termitinemataceae bacterium]|nr:MAG: flagellar assembly protein FliH [Termitinemataceae bacterium]